MSRNTGTGTDERRGTERSDGGGLRAAPLRPPAPGRPPGAEPDDREVQRILGERDFWRW